MNLRHRLVGLLLACSASAFAQTAAPHGAEQEKAVPSVLATAQEQQAAPQTAKEQTNPPADGRPKPGESATPP